MSKESSAALKERPDKRREYCLLSAYKCAACAVSGTEMAEEVPTRFNSFMYVLEEEEQMFRLRIAIKRKF